MLLEFLENKTKVLLCRLGNVYLEHYPERDFQHWKPLGIFFGKKIFFTVFVLYVCLESETFRSQ